MSHQKWSGFTSLPAQYSSDGCFQFSTDLGSLGWTGKSLERHRRGPQASPPSSMLELERSYINSCPLLGRAPFQAENSFPGTQGSLEPNPSHNPWKVDSRGFLSSQLVERARSTSPLRGIHSINSGIFLTNSVEHARKPLSPPVRRRHSLSHLPDWDTEEYNPLEPFTQRVWSGSERDLHLSLPAQRRAEPELSLQKAPRGLRWQEEKLEKWDKKLALSSVKYELLSLKKKQMERSLAQLEKEKNWLELSRYEDERQNGDLREKILHLEMEMAKAKTCLGRMRCCSVSPTPRSAGRKEQSQEMTALQETLSSFQDRLKDLEGEREEMALQLTSTKEAQQLAFSQTSEANQRATDLFQANKALHEEINRLQAACSSISLEKVELHQQVQALTLQLEHAQRSQEGFNDQVSDLHVELVSTKAQANHQDQEKVRMKEELETIQQENEMLSSELGQSRQRLETSLDQLHQLEAEKKILTNQIQALEMERTQLLREQQDARGQGEDMQALQETCKELRISQSLLQRKKEMLQARCEELEAALQHKREEIGCQLTEQQQVAQHWKDRWHQVAVALKTKEEELEHTHHEQQSLSAKYAKILQDSEMLEADAEELSELKGAMHSLKEENKDLLRQLEEHRKASQVLLQQQDPSANASLQALGSEKTSDQDALYKENEGTHDNVKQVENEKSERVAEIRTSQQDIASLLRVELQACKQELELERSRSQDLHRKMQLLQAGSKHGAPPSPQQITFPAEPGDTAAAGVETDHPVSSPQHGFSQISDPHRELLVMESSWGMRDSGSLSEMKSLQQELQRQVASQQEKEELIWALREELEELKQRKSGDLKASLEEVDTELVLVQEELQKVWGMLKTRDTELEEQHLELESARSQYTECSSEKLKLEQLVTSLEQELAEKEQALRHLRQVKEMEKTELEIKASSLELKLAEMEVLRDSTPQFGQAPAPPAVQNRSPGQSRDSRCQGKCSRCDSLLGQLDKMIQSCMDKGRNIEEDKDQAFTYLCELRELLKGVSQRLDGHVTRNPQAEVQHLKQQHQLVTEQLKGLFKQRQHLPSGCRKLPGRQKARNSAEQWARISQEDVREDTKKPKEELKEKQAGDMGLPGSTEDAQSLRQQLQEKTEMVSAMTSEIQGLRQKNENLMKAKLRFQQQIQAIRSLPQQHQERTSSNLLVPQLSSWQELDLASSQRSDSPAPSPGGEQHASSLSSSCNREDLCVATQVAFPDAGDEHRRFASESSGRQLHRSQMRSEPPTLGSKLPATPLSRELPPPCQQSLPSSPVASGRCSPEPGSLLLSSHSQAGSQESLLTPRGSALLLPKPFQLKRPRSPFKFMGSPEPSDN
ncbi:flagellar attachment zone protein 1 isoform X3 [Alligator mississippiensis]|uniref:flagellar attachment zone protein 1 isoform X3 n=1 Tax=Alligator mississippiensis TaxID=8496 RepID=UPI00287813E4|nr:flagellar attachment zone protein 1 isoform X3 [Alligator mississippiensis]